MDFIWPLLGLLVLLGLLILAIKWALGFKNTAEKVLVILAAVVVAALIAIFWLGPRMVHALADGPVVGVASDESSVDATTWANLAQSGPGKNYMKCLEKVTGVTATTLKNYGTANVKGTDLRFILVVNDKQMTDKQARAMLKAKGVSNTSKLRVLHLTSIRVAGAGCKLSKYNKPTVTTALGVLKDAKHLRADRGVLAPAGFAFKK
jgi:hypothetical protein